MIGDRAYWRSVPDTRGRWGLIHGDLILIGRHQILHHADDGGMGKLTLVVGRVYTVERVEVDGLQGLAEVSRLQRGRALGSVGKGINAVVVRCGIDLRRGAVLLS